MGVLYFYLANLIPSQEYLRLSYLSPNSMILWCHLNTCHIRFLLNLSRAREDCRDLFGALNRGLLSLLRSVSSSVKWGFHQFLSHIPVVRTEWQMHQSWHTAWAHYGSAEVGAATLVFIVIRQIRTQRPREMKWGAHIYLVTALLNCEGSFWDYASNIKFKV